MTTEFDVSFEKNGVCHARIVVAKNKDFAERWFRMIEPEAVVLGISENYEYKPGKPVEEVPYEWNGIVFDDVFDDKYSSERILYFDVPLEYLGEDYFDEEDRAKAVGATISISFIPEYPNWIESRFEISPTDADGSDFDWLQYDMDRDQYEELMNLAGETFDRCINVGYSYRDDDGATRYDETQFDLPNINGGYDELELLNLIVNFFKENEDINLLSVTYIEEA